MNLNKDNTLIAFYSRRGNNYSGGRIVDLEIGNTEVIANYIKEITNADIFEINTVQIYPDDYYATTSQAQEELNNNFRPALSKYLDDIGKYDNIFLGFPNWWSTMPMAVFTFLEKYDFTDKNIIPFCTHGGGGFGNSLIDIKKIIPKCNLLNGFHINGSDVNESMEEVNNWIGNL